MIDTTLILNCLSIVSRWQYIFTLKFNPAEICKWSSIKDAFINDDTIDVRID